MPDYRRDNSMGATWFFTVVTYQRRAFLCKDKVRFELKNAIRKTQAQYAFDIRAWVLLPDHIHFIWTLPESDSNFQLRIRLIKRYVTQACSGFLHREHLNTASRRKRKESTIWQRRYWEHRIRSRKDFRHHMDYIHYNPVKHGLTRMPVHWPYSTIHCLVRDGVYTENWASDPDEKQSLNHEYGEQRLGG